MFKEKVSEHLTEETKDLVNQLFMFRIITVIEIIGFSLLLSLLIIPFLHSNPNFFVVFLPVLIFISILYLCMERPKHRT